MVVRLPDLLKETHADGGGVSYGILEPGPIPGFVNVHVVLKTPFQQRLEKRSHLPLVVTSEEVTPMTLGRGDSVSEEQVPEDIVSESVSPRPDEDILGLRIRVASATASPAKLQPVEGPLKGLEVGLDLSSTERVVGDGVRVVADPAGGGDGGGDGVAAGRHDDDC